MTERAPSGLVTFLLTDVVGSTVLWDRLPDVMRTALARHDELIEQTVTEHGGALIHSKGEGDSTFSVFDAAPAAARCAVAIQRRLAAEPWPDNCTIRIRIGVHTGEVEYRDGDYHGPVVNRAARLRAVAGAGQVLLSASTAELTRDELPDGSRLVELGTRPLRGLQQPETVFMLALLDRPAAEAAVEWQQRLPPALAVAPVDRMCGREAERDVLQDRYAAAAAGIRQFVLVTGEPGIGKSLLLADIARGAHRDGAFVFFGTCLRQAPPYQPLLDALRPYVREAPIEELQAVAAATLGELVRVLPELHERLPGIREAGTPDPESGSYLLMNAVAALLDHAATLRPVVLLIDDLHWAQPQTLSMLTYLLGQSVDHRMLVVVSSRQSEPAEQEMLQEVFTQTLREPTSTHLALNGLDEAAMLALLREGPAETTMAPGAEELAGLLTRETAGNPFFAAEIVRHLRETGFIVEADGGAWTIRGSLDEVVLPDSVRGLVHQRVSRLGSEAAKTLRTAAVIGREFELDLLMRVTGLDEDTLLDQVDLARAAALVGDGSRPGAFAFSHALVVNALASDLGPTRRSRLHLHIAEAIEALHGERLDHHVAALAFHHERADADVRRTVHFLLRAAEQSLAALAHDDAVTYCSRAVAVLDAHPDSDDEAIRSQVLLALGEAQRRAGVPDYRTTLLDAAALCRQRGDVDGLVTAALANHRGFFSATGMVDHERVDVLRSALEVVGPNDRRTRARLLAVLALELTFSADLPALYETAEEAVAIGRELDDDEILAECLVAWHISSWRPDNLDQRVAATEELQRLSPESPFSRLWTLLLSYLDAIEVADFARADRFLAAADELTGDIGQPSLRWSYVYCLAARTSIGPHLDEAEMLAADGFRLGQLAGHSDSLEFYATQMLHIRTVQGRAEELVDLIYQTAQERPVGLPAWQSGQLVTYWEAERADLARPIFEQLSTTSFSFPRDVVWLQATASIGPIVARMGSLEDAQVLFDLLLPFEDRIAGTSVAWNGPVAHALGVLASRLGRTEQAAEFFTKAEELIQRTDAPYWLALNQLERARAGCDEPVEQIRLVSAARQWAESAGAARLAKEAATVEADARALAGPGSG